jgi:anti-sigma28 factor (negative regulator of flagellin synthesis)
MKPTIRHSDSHHGQGAEGAAGCSASAARLQTIHELVRSGGYHVPATAIADRIVEQMIATRRERES